MQVCKHASTSMHACMHAAMQPCIHASMHACIHASMHACCCIHASMHACIYACVLPKVRFIRYVFCWECVLLGEVRSIRYRQVRLIREGMIIRYFRVAFFQTIPFPRMQTMRTTHFKAVLCTSQQHLSTTLKLKGDQISNINNENTLFD